MSGNAILTENIVLITSNSDNILNQGQDIFIGSTKLRFVPTMDFLDSLHYTNKSFKKTLIANIPKNHKMFSVKKSVSENENIIVKEEEFVFESENIEKYKIFMELHNGYFDVGVLIIKNIKDLMSEKYMLYFVGTKLILILKVEHDLKVSVTKDRKGNVIHVVSNPWFSYLDNNRFTINRDGVIEKYNENFTFQKENHKIKNYISNEIVVDIDCLKRAYSDESVEIFNYSSKKNKRTIIFNKITNEIINLKFGSEIYCYCPELEEITNYCLSLNNRKNTKIKVQLYEFIEQNDELEKYIKKVLQINFNCGKFCKTTSTENRLILDFVKK